MIFFILFMHIISKLARTRGKASCFYSNSAVVHVAPNYAQRIKAPRHGIARYPTQPTERWVCLLVKHAHNAFGVFPRLCDVIAVNLTTPPA